MKTKKFSKQLVLNKRTIALLNSEDKREVKGGEKWTVPCTLLCVSKTFMCVCDTEEWYCPLG